MSQISVLCIYVNYRGNHVEQASKIVVQKKAESLMTPRGPRVFIRGSRF